LIYPRSPARDGGATGARDAAMHGFTPFPWILHRGLREEGRAKGKLVI
jgi:hypothetical protein